MIIPEYQIEQFKIDWLDLGLNRFKLMNKYKITSEQFDELTSQLYNKSIESHNSNKKQVVGVGCSADLPIITTDKNMTISDLKHVSNIEEYLKKHFYNDKK